MTQCSLSGLPCQVRSHQEEVRTKTLEDIEFWMGNKCQLVCPISLVSVISSGVDTQEKLFDQQEVWGIFRSYCQTAWLFPRGLKPDGMWGWSWDATSPSGRKKTVRNHMEKKPRLDSRAKKWRETSPVNIIGPLDPAVPEVLSTTNLLILWITIP